MAVIWLFLCLTAAVTAQDNNGAVYNDTFFLLNDSKYGYIYQIDYSTLSKIRRDVSPAPQDVDYDPVDKRMYWTDRRHINSARVNGSDSRVLATRYTDDGKYGLAVDSMSRLLFYSDGSMIAMMTMETGYHRTVLTSVSPNYIALDNRNGVVYWSVKRAIERANYDGSQQRTLHEVWDFPAKGLTVDQSGKRLYWAGRYQVESADLDGNNRTVVFARYEQRFHFCGLAHYENNLYVLSQRSVQGVYYTQLSEITKDGRDRRIIYPWLYRAKLDVVHIYSDEPRDRGSNACCGNPCSHICIPTPSNSFKCLCPDGITLGPDNGNCLTGTGRAADSNTRKPRTTSPRTVRVRGPGVLDTTSTQLVTFVCDIDGPESDMIISWTVTCSRQYQRTCLWKPRPYKDDGKFVTCCVTYNDGQTVSGSYQVRIHYPPPGPPVIHGYKLGITLYTGDKLNMTCVVHGGNPLVTSVSFSCTGHPDGPDVHNDSLAEVQSVLVIDPLMAKDNGIRCECTASWKGTDMYTLHDFKWLRVVGSDPVTVSPHSGSSGAAVAGGVAAGVLLFVLIVVIALVVFIKRRKKRRANHRAPPPPVMWHADTDPPTPAGHTSYSPVSGEASPDPNSN